MLYLPQPQVYLHLNNCNDHQRCDAITPVNYPQAWQRRGVLLSSSRSRKLRTRSCSFPSSSIARSGTSRRRAATCICNHAAAVVGRVVTPVSCCPFCHFCARRGEVGKCISGSLSRIAGQQPFGSARPPARFTLNLLWPNKYGNVHMKDWTEGWQVSSNWRESFRHTT